jgi:hypothetical protein
LIGMMRTLAVAGAVALALLPPAVTLGAPTQGSRVAPLPQLPPPRGAVLHSAGQDSFKVPFHIDARPKAAQTGIESTFLPYRWHGWPVGHQNVWIAPTWYQNGCFANNIFGTPSMFQSDNAVPPRFTIGSLVDDRSKHLISSTPSYNPNSMSGSDAVTMSSPLNLQYQFQPTQCGSSSIVNF